MHSGSMIQEEQPPPVCHADLALEAAVEQPSPSEGIDGMLLGLGAVASKQERMRMLIGVLPERSMEQGSSEKEVPNLETMAENCLATHGLGSRISVQKKLLEASNGFCKALEMRPVGRKKRAERMRQPVTEELIGPDGYNYISTMPSVAAAANLRNLWSGEVDDDVKVILEQWVTKLKKAATSTTLVLPGDDVCESPSTSYIDWDSERLAAAERKLQAAVKRRDELISETHASHTKQAEWHTQELSSEEWRVREAQKIIDDIKRNTPNQPPTPIELPLAEPDETPPDVLLIQGSSGVDGRYFKHHSQEDAYIRSDGMYLFYDGHKWGITHLTTKRPLVLTLNTAVRNPCNIIQWYEADMARGKFVFSHNIKVTPSQESRNDNEKYLEGMGFGSQEIEAALACSDGNMEGALDLLVRGGSEEPQLDIQPSPDMDGLTENLSFQTTESQSSLQSETVLPFCHTSSTSSIPLSSTDSFSTPAFAAPVPPPTVESGSSSSPDLLSSMQLMFSTIDPAIIQDVLHQTKNSEHETILALSQLLHTPESTPSTSSLLVPQQASRPVSFKQLPKYRVVPLKGVAYRQTTNIKNIEKSIMGPRCGDIVSSAEATSDWIKLENGYYLPQHKDGRQLLERVDEEAEATQRWLGKAALDLAKDVEDLHIALSGGRVKLACLLLDAGCRTDISSKNGVSCMALVEAHPAFNAVSDEVLNVVKHVTADGRLYVKDASGLTILVRACLKGKAGLILCLLQCGADPCDTDAQGRSAIGVAIETKIHDRAAFKEWHAVLSHLATQEALSTQGHTGESDGYNVLHTALNNGKIGRVNLLLEFGASPLGKSRHSLTPLVLALRSPAFLQQNAASALVIVKKLAVQSIINEPDCEGNTPLVLAAKTGRADFVNAILQMKPNIAARNKQGHTALSYAVMHPWNGDASVVKQLATPEALGGDMEVVQHVMDPGKVDFVEALMEAGVVWGGEAMLDAVRKEGGERWEGVLQGLCGRGLLQIQDEEGNSALHVGLACGMYENAKVLIENGADIAAMNSGGMTPLHVAASRHDCDTRGTGILQSLITPATISVRDASGRTPLHYASSSEQWTTILTLVTAGASPNTQDRKQLYPYQLVTHRTLSQEPAATALKALSTPAALTASVFTDS